MSFENQERPAEEGLRRVSNLELLPPPSTLPDIAGDISEEIVKKQKVEFLLIVKDLSDPQSEWGFPPKEVVDQLFEEVRQDVDDDNIRQYREIPNKAFDTYPKALFVRQNGATMYIPKKYAKWKPDRIMRFLFKEYPDLRADYSILYKTTYTAEAPSHKPGQRSRIGDLILKLDRPFVERLHNYPENFTFLISADWKVSIRGGVRADEKQAQSGSGNEANSPNFSRQFTNSVMMSSAQDNNG